MQNSEYIHIHTAQLAANGDNSANFMSAISCSNSSDARGCEMQTQTEIETKLRRSAAV